MRKKYARKKKPDFNEASFLWLPPTQLHRNKHCKVDTQPPVPRHWWGALGCIKHSDTEQQHQWTCKVTANIHRAKHWSRAAKTTRAGVPFLALIQYFRKILLLDATPSQLSTPSGFWTYTLLLTSEQMIWASPDSPECRWWAGWSLRPMHSCSSWKLQCATAPRAGFAMSKDPCFRFFQGMLLMLPNMETTIQARCDSVENFPSSPQ